MSCSRTIDIFKKDFGKEITIKTAYLEFDYMTKKRDLLDVSYFCTRGIDFQQQFSVLFTKFPKLTEEDMTPPILPEPPKVIDTLPPGEGHNYNAMEYKDDGTLTVGCNEFSKKQVKSIRDFLNKVTK